MKETKTSSQSFFSKYKKGALIGLIVGALGGLLLFILAFSGLPFTDYLFYIIFPLDPFIGIMFPTISIVQSFLINGLLYAVLGVLIQYLYQTYGKKK